MMEIPPLPPPSQKATAALLIIGDELLKGSVLDQNGTVAAKALLEAGFELRKVVTVADKEEDIEAELLALFHKYTIVITSGGLGPTLDDVTIKAASAAFQKPRNYNSRMLDFLQQFVGNDSISTESICPAGNCKEMSSYTINSNHKSAALLPEDCILNFHPSKSTVWPVLQLENVFILPGVPSQFQGHIAVLKEFFFQPILAPLESCFQEGRNIYLTLQEDVIFTKINDIMRKYSHVKIGSYPSDSAVYKTLLEVKGQSAAVVDTVVRDFISLLPVGCILKVEAIDYRSSQVSLVTSKYLQT